MNRRNFLHLTGAGVISGAFSRTLLAKDGSAALADDPVEIKGAVVLCNHWTECGIGGTFPSGEINHRWYASCYSTVFNLEQSRRWLSEDHANRFCHELDMFFLPALEKEDPSYLASVVEILRSGKLELVGGAFGQPESQVFGWESALRQLSLGQLTAQKYIGKFIDTYLVEEQSFYTQLPQILKLAGFKYASLQFQNSGTPDAQNVDLIWWKGPDGSRILTVPNHAGLTGCYKQESLEPYRTALESMRHFKSPLIFQWLELWVPGMDWGASVAPYKEAIDWAAAQGFKQMTLTEYIEWAGSRSEPGEALLKMDQSNYDNNFFQGGWGYENERQARLCNQCESLLLSAESLAALAEDEIWKRKLEQAIADGWPRMLISQNHDAYLAGSILFYLDGVKSYQSELTVQQSRLIHDALQKKMGLNAAVKPGSFKLYNPCPWPVTAPVMFEIDDWGDLGQTYYIYGLPQGRESVTPAFRSDSGRITTSPVMVSLPALGGIDLQLDKVEGPAAPNNLKQLSTPDNGHSWQVENDAFHGITFGPLTGTWKQIGLFFYDHPNTNIETMHTDLATAPARIEKTIVAPSGETVVWKKDLMRIKEAEEPALRLAGLTYAGQAGIDLVEFQFRLESTIRFQVGPRPEETWNFQLRLGDTPKAIYADSPFAEEQRQTDRFYCCRYIRFEMADRDILWCPSQNTLFRNLDKREKGLFECKVLDFSFNGVTQWGFRFYAAETITPADSIRLAESFHRRCIPLPADTPALTDSGLACDQQEIVLFHLMPASRPSAVLVRTCNVSDQSITAQFKMRLKPKSVKRVDLLANVMQDDVDRHGRGWIHRYRPWEIATFELRV
ncbi:MAG TPA: hypothetical protein PK843_13890 [bacterium]|nr:hypothetical protein [bacterium]